MRIPTSQESTKGGRRALTLALLRPVVPDVACTAVACTSIMVWNPQNIMPGMAIEEIWASAASQQRSNEYLGTFVNVVVMPTAASGTLWLANTSTRRRVRH